MGHVFDFHEAVAYEKWMKQPENELAFAMEIQLLRSMMQPRAGESILDIGCGTGACLPAFLDMGLKVTALDASTYMLDIALAQVGNRVGLLQGGSPKTCPSATTPSTTPACSPRLEFVDDAQKALAEACRVAKDRLFIGVLNRYAIKGVERRRARDVHPIPFTTTRVSSASGSSSA